MKISALYIYPVKGMAGIPLHKALVGTRGLAYDRRWMVVDRDGLFLSQREIPQLAFLQPSLSVSGLILRHRFEQVEPLSVELHPPQGTPLLDVQVWDDRCKALSAGTVAEEWLSSVLHTPCRLVFQPEQPERPVKPTYGLPGEAVSFADSCPLLAIGEASLEGLNQRLKKAAPIGRFRPNIVFSGGKPYEEEGWKAFRIGSLSFRGIRPCGRCQVVNIDQATAEVGKEPLRTLSTYRRDGHKIRFGLYASLQAGQREGHIHVGDSLHVDEQE